MISVCIAAYNAAKYLVKCLDSLEQQDYRDFEVVIVDDGSTDNTGDVIHKYDSRSQMRIRYFRLDRNYGISYVRNKCLTESLGQFIYFLDADDWLEHDALSVLYTKYEDTKAEIVGCDFYLGENKAFCLGIHDLHVARRMSIEGRWSVVWRHLIKKSLICENNIKFPDNADGGEDYIFVTKAIMKSQTWAYVDKPIYHYRINNNSSLMRSVNLKGLKDQFDTTYLLEQFIKGEYGTDSEYIGYLNARYLYLKKELFKTSLKAWSCWHPESNKFKFQRENSLKDRLVYVVLSVLSKFL